MITRFVAALPFAASSFLLITGLAADLPTVTSRKEPVTNKYDSITITDNYQWLENAQSPEVRDWMRLENARTRAYFSLLPYRDGIAQQLTQIYSDASASFGSLIERKGKIFALRFKPPAQHPVLV